MKASGKCALKSRFAETIVKDHPKAIWVPANESGILPAKAFFALAKLRHVQVEVDPALPLSLR